MLESLLALFKAGVDVLPYIDKLAESFKTPDGPTDAQLDDLSKMEYDLDNKLATVQPGDGW